MDSRERSALRAALDEVRVMRTLPYSFVYARHGTDNEAFMGIFRWPADAADCGFRLRRQAERSRLVTGMLWFLDDCFVFRSKDKDDPGLRYGFERNGNAGGLRDVHPWIQQGRFRMVGDNGDPMDVATWFEDAAQGQKVRAQLALLGVRPPASEQGEACGGDGLDGLDGLDELDTIDLS